MIRHIVLFRFLEEAEGKSKTENVLATKEMLEALPEKIPQIVKSEVFVNTDGINSANADLILISDFRTPEDLQTYLVHPDHKAVGKFMIPLRESRMGIDLTV